MPLTAHERNVLYRERHREFLADKQRRFAEEHKEYYKEKGKERIQFKGKRLTIGFNPRRGVCSNCGFKGFTHLHHEKYEEGNPLAHTKELCVICHRREHLNANNEQ